MTDFKDTSTEDAWYDTLVTIADRFGVSVRDKEAWIEGYYLRQTPQSTFFDEYPEYLETYLEEHPPFKIMMDDLDS